jgi:hypothetical protein
MPKVDYSTGMKIEYSILYLSPLFILLFINNIFKNKYHLISKILYIIIPIMGIKNLLKFLYAYPNIIKEKNRDELNLRDFFKSESSILGTMKKMFIFFMICS